MGGPCCLVESREKHGQYRHLKRRAPACTDNFQIRPFMFNGLEWYSVEQCFQAMKFTSAHVRERLRLTTPRKKDNDQTYSERLWDMGQREADIRPDWDSVKADTMYRIVGARYAQHADLSSDLLSTGDAEIVGARSTSWYTKCGRSENWGTWNGIIQMRVREELRPASERRSEVLRSLVDMFGEAGFGTAGMPGQIHVDSDSCVLCRDHGIVDGLEGTCPLCDGLGLSSM